VVLKSLDATLRGAPSDVAFRLDADTLHAGDYFTFSTRLGSLDILGSPAGAPRYETLKRPPRRSTSRATACASHHSTT
jgi:hypothetical protein